jgi:hypothetical protein
MQTLSSEQTTTGIKYPELSLLDTAGCKVKEWYICYLPRVPYYWFAHYWKQGFRHVELTRPIQYGPGIRDVMWLNVCPTYETLDVELSYDPTPPWLKLPGVTIQKVTAIRPLGRVRSWFDMGPPSCVEIVKHALGINAFFVRTPWQLYKYISRRNGFITSE